IRCTTPGSQLRQFHSIRSVLMRCQRRLRKFGQPATKIQRKLQSTACRTLVGHSTIGSFVDRQRCLISFAVDINPEGNELRTKGSMPKFAIDAFKRQGARWGEDYKGRKDPMHFEFVS